MQIKKHGQPISILITLSILLWYHFLYIIPIRGSLELIFFNDNLVLFLGLAGLLLSLYCLCYEKKYLVKYTKIEKLILIMLFTFLLITIYSTMIYSDQSIIRTIKIGSPFMILFWTIPAIVMFEYLNQAGKLNTFWDKITILSTLWYILIIIQRAYYTYNGSFLFDFASSFRYSYSSVISRDFGLRFGLSAFGNIAILYNFSKILDNANHKIWRYISLILGLFCLICIQQTRMFIIIILGIMFLMILSKENTNIYFLFKIITVFSIIIFIINSDVFNDFVYGIFGQNGDQASLNNRIYSISYYLKCFFNNPIFGNAFCDTSISSYYSIEHGNLGIAYYSDVGLIGLLANIGICCIPFFIYPCYLLIKYSLTIIKCKKISKSLFVMALLVYVIFTSFTLLITNPERCIAFPYILAYICFLYSNL